MSESEVALAWVLPCRSQEFESGPVAQLQHQTLAIRYDFDTETGAYEWEAIEFRGVIGVEFTDHGSCSRDQVAAYDKLVEVGSSELVARLQAGRIDPAPDARHLRIYFDEVGWYDVVAQAFDPPRRRV